MMITNLNMLLLALRKEIQCLTVFVSISALVVAQSRSQSKLTTETITINLSKTYQAIDNFGASDAWACQFVGNWPDVKRNAIADLLFSREFGADSKPIGIGLSIWRFNIGAGSAEQGRESGIRDKWRRAESLLDNSGQYDWSKQSGQLWFLQAAKQRGVNQFLGFTNSPPVYYTRNGKAYADSAKVNLQPKRFADFAAFLTKVTKGIHERTGVLFNYLSPANEPQWDWSDGGQEGTPFNNSDISGIVKALDSSLIKHKLPVKITVAEAGDYKYLYSASDKPDKGNQVEAFFKQGSPNFVGRLPSVARLIAGHSYFTTSPGARAIQIRKEVASKIASIPNLKLWQSEYCILGNNDGEIDGNKRDLGMTSALYLAQVIHNDLVYANASAWHWWLSISPYNYKDGLIYVDKNEHDGNYYPSKMLWALGNYSRFISPGAVRVNAEIASNSGLSVSAFWDKKSNTLVTVIINSGVLSKEISLKLNKRQANVVSAYTTTETAELAPLKMNRAIVPLPAKSITTLLSDLR